MSIKNSHAKKWDIKRCMRVCPKTGTQGTVPHRQSKPPHAEEDAGCTPQVVRQPSGEQNQMPPRALSQFPSQKQPGPNLRYLGLVKSKSFCHYCPSVGSQHKIHRMIPLCHLHLLTTLPVLLLSLGDYPLRPASPVLELFSHHKAYRSPDSN